MVEEKINLKVTNRERKEIEYQRKFGYGKIVVFLEGGQPIRIEEGVKSTKL